MNHLVYLSLGSNIGDRLNYLQNAVSDLQKISQSIEVSSVYETEPIGTIKQENFYNIAVKLVTLISVEELFDLCQSLEKKQNRIKKIHWGPRTLDIDIIAFDQFKIESDRLIVPHPEFINRRFVLLPLAELDSNAKINEKTIGDYLLKCPDQSMVKKLSHSLFLAD